jgi:large subunit ribosomal protein L13
MIKTHMANAEQQKTEQKWWLVDATGKTVGRLASDIAVILMGKHRPDYTPHVLMGDFVVVLNVDKVVFTGKKWQQKTYAWYTGHPRQHTVTAQDRLIRDPQKILQEAVRRMLPKNKLAFKMLAKMKLYCSDQHPHQAQQPESIELGVK